MLNLYFRSDLTDFQLEEQLKNQSVTDLERRNEIIRLFAFQQQSH